MKLKGNFIFGVQFSEAYEKSKICEIHLWLQLPTPPS